MPNDDDETRDRRGRRLPTPPPLPANRTALEASRITGFEVNINDLVDGVHLILFDEDEVYKRFLYATHDAQAKEGSLSADNYSAAQIIRTYARQHGIAGIAEENLATISTALNVVLRRFGMSRKQRRNMVHGERVPDDTNGGE